MPLTEWGPIAINIMISLTPNKIGNKKIECYLTKSILVKFHLLIIKYYKFLFKNKIII
jgi:hypothetical protein